MKRPLIIRAIAVVEVLIGLSTLAGMLIFARLGELAKPFNVLVFVIITSIISILLGAGLFTYRKRAAELLIFFSGCIILTKLMAAAGLLHFNGELLTFVATDTKNIISVIYHGFVIIVLTRRSANKILR